MFSPELEKLRPKAGKYLLEVIKVSPQRFSKNLTKVSEFNKAKLQKLEKFSQYAGKVFP